MIKDEAFAGQMAARDQLLEAARADVVALAETARPAAQELLDLVLTLAYPDVDGRGASVTRQDGIKVRVDRGDPLGTLGRLVQEDLCILEKVGDEHVLTGAVLCFPASWTLSEKVMRPLIGIHDMVPEYDTRLAARVQRLFNGVQVGRPLWRFNALWYSDPTLHQPRRSDARREAHSAEDGAYFRSERQCILRLPKSNAVIFSIHTFVLDRANAQTDWVQT